MPRRKPTPPSDDESNEPEGTIPPWRELFPAPPGEYSLFRTFADIASAEVVKSILQSENVNCYIEPRTLEGRLMTKSIQLWVESRSLHRARWVLDESDLSEAELCYLATGELPEPE